MRIKLTYESLNGKIILPNHYNYYLQSLIYQTFSPDLAGKLHEEGFLLGKRPFKLFTFSRILEKGKPSKDKKFLIFDSRITFYFSSPKEEIVENLAERSIREREFHLLNNKIYLAQIEIVTLPRIEEKIVIKALSPITVYSTIKKENNETLIHYYKPIEEDFSKLIEKNAKKKYKLIYQKEPPEDSYLHIKPLKFSVSENLKIILFKNTPIEGYTGIYEISGTRELILSTYEAGLGNKNSEGFGMWEIWKKKEKEVRECLRK
ncbi:MAG: CRISPR-associated endoribonuclease Cas6 [Dictyoglomus sp. NZ13-RE01]|nr:MAG: CRISPR-associated endoribonuclease Cas6 [Dictyoglomus sp. NZ13-RE01]